MRHLLSFADAMYRLSLWLVKIFTGFFGDLYTFAFPEIANTWRTFAHNSVGIATTFLGLITVRMFVEDYIINDYRQVVAVGVLLVVDTILGGAKYLKAKQFNLKKLGKGLYGKCAGYAILILGCSTLSIHNPLILGWLLTAITSTLAVKEFLSIADHVERLGWIKLPVFIRRSLDRYTDTGQLIQEPAAQPEIQLQEKGE
jgi:hypothetical protein